MSKNGFVYICTSCGHKAPKWLGKCPECEQWNSFVEEIESNSKIKKKNLNFMHEEIIAKELISFVGDTGINQKFKTGIEEFDRVLGEGITKSSLILIGGDPGIGKSTLLMAVAGKLIDRYKSKILYVSGEESGNQVNQRASRLKINSPELFFINDCSIEKIKNTLSKLKPTFLIIDSIQTIYSEDLDSPPGTVSQIREVTYQLMEISKQNSITTFVVGHVTKDGNIAGPKILEHMVDCVIYFEGDSLNNYRFLRCIKNRYGNTNEVGIFQMSEVGLSEIANPGLIFLEHCAENSFGRALTCILEGTRPIIVETQALVIENKFGNGRRTTQGFDLNRLNLIIAVIEKYFKLPVSYSDVYLNIVGGLRLTGRDSDLAIIASIISSFSAKAVDGTTILIGEVGLTGEIRSVPFIELRAKEMSKMNYKTLICSAQSTEKINMIKNLNVIGINNVSDIRGIIF